MTPADPNFAARIRASFARQSFMAHLGATLGEVAPGRVDIEMPFDQRLSQQHGFVHAGANTTIADSAAGYAALSLFGPDVGVLTAEFKVNLLRPAAGTRFIARGRVLKPGRTLTVCQSDVFAISAAGEAHVLTGLFSLMAVAGAAD